MLPLMRGEADDGCGGGAMEAGLILVDIGVFEAGCE